MNKAGRWPAMSSLLMEVEMCCDEYASFPEDTVGKCPECDGNVDKEGFSTESGCNYSPPACDTCKWCPCDGSC